jgi:hypothetical protein
MTDEALRRAYREGLIEPAGRTDCPPPEALGALVVGEGDELARLAVLDHVMSCTACHRDFELLRAIERARPAIAHQKARTWALAASVVLALGAGTWMVRDELARPGEDTVRGGSGGFSLVSPAPGAAASRPVTLSWHAVPDAQSYAVELLAADGTPVHAWTTMDTVIVVADSIPLDAARDYAWWVRARRRDGSEVRSPVTRFTVR